MNSGGGPPKRFQIPQTRVTSPPAAARVAESPPRKLHVPRDRPQSPSPHLLSPTSNQSFVSHGAPAQQLSFTQRPPSPKPLRTVSVSMVPDTDGGTWSASWAPTPECSIPPICISVTLGNVNYAHFEAVRGGGGGGHGAGRFESMVRSELQSVLSGWGVQPSHATLHVRVEAGQASTLSLAVDGDEAASRAATDRSPNGSGRRMPSVRIVGGDWPTRIVVAIASDNTDGMRWLRLQCLANLRRWLSDRRTPPFTDSIAGLAAMLGPYHPEPTVAKVSLDSSVLWGDGAAAGGGTKQAPRTVEPRHPEVVVDAPQLVDEAKRVVSPYPRNYPAMDNQRDATHLRVKPRPVSDRAASALPTLSQPSMLDSTQSDDDGDEILEAVVSLPLKQAKTARNIFTSATSSPPLVAESPPPKPPPALQLFASPSRRAAGAANGGAKRATPESGGHVHVVSPQGAISPNSSSPKRKTGSLLLRVSTSPMRTEDYYVVGGEHVSHVDVTLHVPVLVRSWSEREACVECFRASLLAYREMLEYYARDDVWDLLSGGCHRSGGTDDGAAIVSTDRSRAIQMLLDCTKHVIVTLDVLTHPPGEPAPITTPVITVVVVCSILCECLVERLVLGELRTAVAKERNSTGGTAFRRLLKQLASLMATAAPSSTALGLLSERLPSLGDLVVSLPASLRRCRLMIGSECLWEPTTPVAQLVTTTMPPLERQEVTPPHASLSPEMTVVVQQTSGQPANRHVVHDLFEGDDDDDPTPLPIPSATPTPLRSPSSVVEATPQVTLCLVFSAMLLRPLQQAMTWWRTNASDKGCGVGRSPAEQLLRACHFDIMDALQAFCYEPEDCTVRFAMPTAANNNAIMSVDWDRVGDVGCVRLHATVRPSQWDSENSDAFRASIVRMCTSASAFAALKDVYGQLCMDEDGANAVAVNEDQPVLDVEETTFNGIPIARMLPAAVCTRAAQRPTTPESAQYYLI